MKRISAIVLTILWGFLCYNLFKSLDFFELYLYSLPGLNFNLAGVMSRVFLGFCGSIPLLLILRPFSDRINKLWLLIPSVISVGLILNQLFLSAYTCKCFILHSWNESLVFELFLGLTSMLSFISYHFIKQDKELAFAKVIFPIFSLTFLVVIFILNAPDWFLYKKPQHLLTPFIYDGMNNNNGVDLFKELNSEKEFQTICLFNPNCQFCQRASTKIYLMAKKNGFSEHVTFVFSGNPFSIPTFMETYQIENIQTRYLNGEDLLRIANGTIPNIQIMRADTVHFNFGYRDMFESVFQEVYP